MEDSLAHVDGYGIAFGGVEVTKQLLFGMEADVAARGIGTTVIYQGHCKSHLSDLLSNSVNRSLLAPRCT